MSILNILKKLREKPEQQIPDRYMDFYLKLRENTPQDVKYEYKSGHNNEDASWTELKAYKEGKLIFKLEFDEFSSKEKVIDWIKIYNITGLKLLDELFEDVINPALIYDEYYNRISIEDNSIYSYWESTRMYKLFQKEMEKKKTGHDTCLFTDTVCPVLKRLNVNSRSDLNDYIKILPQYCQSCKIKIEQ